MASSNEHSAEAQHNSRTVTILVTGANSGLGFGICCRLIDEFLLTRPELQTLHLLFSTRDRRKSDDTLRLLNVHLQKALRNATSRTLSLHLQLETRVKLEGVLLELTDLLSVKRLAGQLLRSGEKVDVVIWNAGIGGWKRVNPIEAAIAVCTDLVYATTYPDFNIGHVGLVTKSQSFGSDLIQSKTTEIEPRLGQVFTANVLGHYMLTHWLTPLFTPSSRIVWVGSISAIAAHFSLDDFQALRTPRAYESSKRLMAILALTSELPSTQSSVKQFLSAPKNTAQEMANRDLETPRPKIYLTHPGLAGSGIAVSDIAGRVFLFVVLYLARWFGSPWHNVQPYTAAVSAVWCALSPPEQLEQTEESEGKGNWGSSSNIYGNERVVRTETEGWGWCGVPGKIPGGSIVGPRGRHRELRTTDAELREDFEEEGIAAWRQMEELRQEWEKRLEGLPMEKDNGA